jgi:hypothetical protein
MDLGKPEKRLIIESVLEPAPASPPDEPTPSLPDGADA